MTLSIIIVNYNVKYFLEQCLCSVEAAIENIEAEVIVIDNCSPDGSIAYLRQQFTWVIFIENNTNDGFARANNKALKQASGQYILFLNPDTILAEDTLEQCIFFFTKNPAAGAVGVRMIDGSGHFLPESKRAFPSPIVSFYKLIGLSSLYPSSKRFGRYALGYLSEKEVHEVDVLAGAFMMIRKEILDKTGGFDEQFFMYAEDIDLSYRIQKTGYKNFYLGNISIVHFKGESTKRSSLNYVKLFYNAMNLFVKKHYRGAGAWLLRQALQTGIVARGFISVIGLSFHKKKAGQSITFEEIVLLGDDANTNDAEQIVRKHYPKIPVAKSNYSPATNSSFTKALVVFCTGELSYKKSIEFIQQQKASSYKWFGKNSKSIVGSDSKNSSGEVLS